jgi:hypothetical protein
LSLPADSTRYTRIRNWLPCKLHTLVFWNPLPRQMIQSQQRKPEVRPHINTQKGIAASSIGLVLGSGIVSLCIIWKPISNSGVPNVSPTSFLSLLRNSASSGQSTRI